MYYFILYNNLSYIAPQLVLLILVSDVFFKFWIEGDNGVVDTESIDCGPESEISVCS